MPKPSFEHEDASPHSPKSGYEGSAETIAYNTASHGANQIFNNTGTVIINQTTQPEEKPPDEIYDAPDLLSPYFTGRVAELEDIQIEFSKPANEVPRCIVFGMPGLGKTQLALKYAASSFKRKQFSFVFWISASSLEKISRGFARILDLVCYPGRTAMDPAAKMAAARLWLENDRAQAWLLVVDNVQQETIPTIRDNLPRRAQSGKILITARTKTIAEALAVVAGTKQSILSLKQPSSEDAIELLIKSTGKPTSDMSNAVDIVTSVGYLPLAVDQAASFMKESGCSAAELLNIYKTEQVEKMMDWENKLSQHEEQSVASTFALAFEQLEATSPITSNLLRILAFLDPESISVNMLVKGSTALQKNRVPGSQPERLPLVQRLKVKLTGRPKSISGTSPQASEGRQASEDVQVLLQSPVELQRAIQQLQNLSLLVSKSDDGAQTLWIHDLVHLLLRTRFVLASDRAVWLKQAILIAGEAFSQIGNRRAPENWPQCELFVSHFQALSNQAEKLKMVDEELLIANSWLAAYFLASGRYDEALAIQKRMLDIDKKVLGTKAPHTLVDMNNMASTLGNKGQWDEAEKLYLEVMQIRKKILGAQHPETLNSMGNLATVYRAKGLWNEAEKLEIKVMEARKRVLGADHPQTLLSIANLASTLSSQDRWDEAERLEVEVLKERKRVLGVEHPDTLTSMDNLGVTYSMLGDQDKSEPLKRQAMEIRKRVLGAEHPDTLTSMANLAATFWEQDKYTEAEHLELAVLEIRRRVLGPEHPDTLGAMDNLAHTWMALDRNEDALKLMTEAFTARKRTLGSTHPDTISSKETLDSWQDEN